MNREADGKMGRVLIEVDLANQQDLVRASDGTIAPGSVRRLRAPGVIDTGASHLVLPKAIAKQLGVPVVGKTRVRYADHRQSTRDVVGNVEVQLLGRQGTFKAVVEPRRNDVLVGAIVLEDLDLLVDCRTQKLRPRDPRFIIAELE
jgi:clan AA aspartic protease